MSPTVPVQRSTTGAANVLLTQHVFPSARQKSSPWLFMQHVAGVPHTPQKTAAGAGNADANKHVASELHTLCLEQRETCHPPNWCSTRPPEQQTYCHSKCSLQRKARKRGKWKPRRPCQRDRRVQLSGCKPQLPTARQGGAWRRAAASRSRARGYGVPAAAALPSSGLDPGSGWC